jgi:hypothetical protein
MTDQPSSSGPISRQLSEQSNDVALRQQLELVSIKRDKSEQYRAAEDPVTIIKQDIEALRASRAFSADLEVCSETGDSVVLAHAVVMAMRSPHLAEGHRSLARRR